MMPSISTAVRGMRTWFSMRVPGLGGFYRKHLTEYQTPKNLNVWYCFGALALILIISQFATGVFLAIHYIPSTQEAFTSVQQTIMRDVSNGWLLRYMHTTGASFLFIVLYLHMYRSVLYGSHRNPREIVWLLGMCLYLLIIFEAFTGYVLPWGQLSFWAAKIVGTLISAVPWVGRQLSVWIIGGNIPGDATLGRFFVIHAVVLPLIVVGLIATHILALHQVGSTNPDGHKKSILAKNAQEYETVGFHPYYTLKDACAASVMGCVGAGVIFFYPEAGHLFIESGNAVPANPWITPEQTHPPWYFSPFFAMLRAMPGQIGGMFVVTAAICLMFILPWLDKSSSYTIRQQSLFVRCVRLLLLPCCVLGLAMLGNYEQFSVTQLYLLRGFTSVFFGILVMMPWWSRA